MTATTALRAGLVGLALVLAGAAHAQLREADADPEAFVRLLLEQQPGVASVAVLRGGSVRQATVYRQDTRSAIASWSEAEAPMFEIGSVSKVFTGLLLAQAVERGDLKLTDTLGELLKQQVPGMSPGVASITLRQLVTHTSCLPRQIARANGQAEREIRELTRAQLWTALAAVSVTGGPPCVGVYSNLGFAVLGELLSEREGQPWEALVRERITGPLGMRDTVVRLGERESRMALPFVVDDDVPLWDMNAFVGAGGLRSTAADMMTFARAVAAGRQGPLGPAAERLVAPLAPFQGHEIGYAVFIRSAGGKRVVSHDGLTGGFRASWMVLPQGEALVALVSNAQAPTHKLVNAVDRSLFPVPSPVAAADAGALADYEGVFRFGGEGLLAFSARNGSLFVRGSQEGFSPLLAAAPGRFVRPESAAQFDFVREAGRVVSVTLSQGGRVTHARRDAAAPPAYRVAGRDELQAFAGRYKMPWGAVMEVTATEGQLITRMPRQWRLPVFSVADRADHFAYSIVKAELQFERDAQGRVEALVLHQNGVHRAPRLQQ